MRAALLLDHVGYDHRRRFLAVVLAPVIHRTIVRVGFAATALARGLAVEVELGQCSAIVIRNRGMVLV
jgi:hypothetical protein